MAYSLDLKDRRILFELDKNSRAGFAEIGKKVRLSKQVVKFRVERMLERGIIQEFITTWNMSNLGYQDYAMLLRFKGVTKIEENELIEFFKASNNVSWVVATEGRFDLLVNMRWKNIADYSDFLQKFTYAFGNKIKERAFYTRRTLDYFNRVYLVGEKTERAEAKHMFVPAEKIELDKLDEKIGKILSKNSRTSLQELAKETGITAEAVRYRIKRLEKQELVGYWIKLNIELLGISYYKVIFWLRNITPKRLNEFISFAAEHPSIIYLIQEIGLGDVHFDFEVMRASGFREILAEIREKFSDIIDSYEILTITKEHKLNYSLII